ncbi:MAG: PAS domain-containing sensor histidine kinase, partial [Gemmatimonadetes bacterium]|nr:PAS domain-containing sensor histidine kinase [Gemmatimonadota bacterium]
MDYHAVANIVAGLHLVCLHDMTRYAQTEDALRRSEQQYRSLIANIPDVTWTTNARGDVRFISPNVQAICGYAPEEYHESGHQLWLDRIHPDDQGRIRDAYRLLFLEIRDFDVEYRFQTRSGRWIWLSDRSVGVYEDGGERLADGVASDISRRKQAEHTVDIFAAELRRRYEEMQQFVCTVAHDLKSPILTIHGYLQHARQEVQQHDLARLPELMDRIEQAAHRMKTQIDDFLELTRVGRAAHDPQDIDVTQVVRGVVEDHADAIAERGVSVRVQPALPGLCADAALVREVFDNLLSNALKYGCSAPHPVVEISGHVKDGEARYCVRDNGPGIPADCHERIFDLFERLRSDVEGTGVKNAQEAH